DASAQEVATTWGDKRPLDMPTQCRHARAFGTLPTHGASFSARWSPSSFSVLPSCPRALAPSSARGTGGTGNAEMPVEPIARENRDAFERARLFEQMRRARDDLESLFGLKLCVRSSVELDDQWIASTYDQERGRANSLENRSRQIGPPPSRHD